VLLLELEVLLLELEVLLLELEVLLLELLLAPPAPAPPVPLLLELELAPPVPLLLELLPPPLPPAPVPVVEPPEDWPQPASKIPSPNSGATRRLILRSMSLLASAQRSTVAQTTTPVQRNRPRPRAPDNV
jgi:hypothetical protein